MSSASAPRSIVVDQELIRGMSWDALIYTLTRPLSVIAYAALLAAFIVDAIVLSRVAGIDDDRAATLTWTLIAIAALAVASIVYTRASVRRVISTAMPSGSKVSAEVHDAGIRLIAAHGVSNMPYSTFRSLRVGRHAAILRLQTRSVITAVPRVLLADDDIAALRARI